MTANEQKLVFYITNGVFYAKETSYKAHSSQIAANEEKTGSHGGQRDLKPRTKGAGGSQSPE